MKKIMVLLSLLALSSTAQASTSYGSLGNFDVVNDTGETGYGFEIEIDDVHSKDIGGHLLLQPLWCAQYSGRQCRSSAP